MFSGCVLEIAAGAAQSSSNKIVGYYYAADTNTAATTDTNTPAYIPKLLDDIQTASGVTSSHPVLLSFNVGNVEPSKVWTSLEVRQFYQI